MNLVEVKESDHLLVRCQSGTVDHQAISIVTAFCREFGIRSIVIVHNDRLIQVTAHGVVKTPELEPKGLP